MTVQKDFRKLDRLIAESPGDVDDWLRGVTVQIHADIVASFGTSPPGRVYIRGNVVHVASQPGYPPNVDTGALRASMRWERKAQLSYEIMDGVEYGIKMEYGTEDIAPRPFIVPIFEEWRERQLAEDLRNAGLLD